MTVGRLRKGVLWHGQVEKGNEMREKVRDAIEGTKNVSYIKKPALYLSVCDSCGKKFSMQPYSKGTCPPGELNGTFDKCVRTKGNMLIAHVCSLKCAHDIFIGGWKKLAGYGWFVQEGATLVRVEIDITSLVTEEQDAIAKWEEMK